MYTTCAPGCVNFCIRKRTVLLLYPDYTVMFKVVYYTYTHKFNEYSVKHNTKHINSINYSNIKYEGGIRKKANCGVVWGCGRVSAADRG